jgi:RNA polymerase-associated protein
MGPLLWRLSHYDVKLPQQARPVMEYGEKLFCRRSFRQSLSAFEKKMRC